MTDPNQEIEEALRFYIKYKVLAAALHNLLIIAIALMLGALMWFLLCYQYTEYVCTEFGKFWGGVFACASITVLEVSYVTTMFLLWGRDDQ